MLVSFSMRPARLIPLAALVLALAPLALVPGCGDDSATGGAGGAGGGGGGGPSEACEGVDTTGCTISLGPSDDVTNELQTALIEAESGSTVCLCPGTYLFDNELQVNTPDLTIRGVGATRDDVVLDFANQIGGDDGLTATSDGFTVENLSVKNTTGNGIVATGSDGVTFRNLKVWWDAGSVTGMSWPSMRGHCRWRGRPGRYAWCSAGTDAPSFGKKRGVRCAYASKSAPNRLRISASSVIASRPYMTSRIGNISSVSSVGHRSRKPSRMSTKATYCGWRMRA